VGDVAVRAEARVPPDSVYPEMVPSIHSYSGFQGGMLTVTGTDCQAVISPPGFQQDRSRRTLQTK